MSQHKGNHVKHTKFVGTLGESPVSDLRGISIEARAIRDKHRSPFAFCGRRWPKVKS
jgi:hypothetical protein